MAYREKLRSDYIPSMATPTQTIITPREKEVMASSDYSILKRLIDKEMDDYYLDRLEKEGKAIRTLPKGNPEIIVYGEPEEEQIRKAIIRGVKWALTGIIAIGLIII